jgi:hypothetical protein
VVATTEKLLSSWKDFKNYFKYKRNEIRIKDFILRLRIKDDIKLSKKRINSSSVLKANVVKQVVKFHNKNQKKLVVKGKRIAKKINDKCFICNKIAHATKFCKIRVNKESLQKELLEPISMRLITLLIKFQKLTYLVLFPKPTSLTILSSGRLTLVIQDMYVVRRECFPFTKKWIEKTHT